MTEKEIKLNQLRQYQSLPLSGKIRLTEMRIREWHEAFDGQVSISISGKDSCCMADQIWRIYPEVPAVFADTGNELESVKENIYRMINAGRPIEIVKPKMTFEEVVQKFGYPVVSKKVSDYANRCRRTSNPQVLRRHLKGENADGTPSPMSKIPLKWQKLLDAEFDVTNKCCGILKFNPTSEYQKATGRKAFVGTMADESFARMNSYLNHGGCNAFDQKDQNSRPIMFWTEQDVLEYIVKYDVMIPSAYGEIKRRENGTLRCSRDQRTGCKFCLFGVHLEKGENRIQRLAKVEPESYRHAIEDLHYDEVMDFLGVDWKPCAIEEQQTMKLPCA